MGADAQQSFVGQRCGPYVVSARIGTGGMGEVYRARDTRLDRDVAIKILQRTLGADPGRLARFEREARLLATLNHAHIGAIYGLEEFRPANSAQPVPALVLELVDGETLADVLDRGPIPIGEVLTIARQIADALAAAHEKGIIHRDLKPANIKLTSSGTVKVLDFGLGKALGADAASDDTQMATLTVDGTIEGVVLGTPAYMSPEQAKGQPADKRADLWAFGCVLYEMLTARRVFDGDSASEVIAHVLTRSPEWSLLPPATPEPVRRLLRRCLERDRYRRLESAADARLEIDDALQPREVSGVRASATAPVRRIWIAAPWALLLAVVAVAGYVFFTTRRPPETALLTDAKPLTSEPGFSGQPTLSPDGRLFAYASDRSGRGDYDIWVQQIAGGVPLRLTDDEGDDQSPEFSPDGSQIAFRSERGGGGVYLVSALGGAARLIAAGGRDPRFSPDGSRLAYWTGPPRGALAGRRSQAYVVSLAGGAPIRLMPDFQVANTPVWAPDGRSLLVLAQTDPTQRADLDLWRVSVEGGTPRRSGILDWQRLREDTYRTGAVSFGTWSPSGLVMARDAKILLMPLAVETSQLAGEPRVLASGVGSFGRPVMQRDGEVLVATSQVVRAVERLPLGPSNERPVPLYADNAETTMRAGTSLDGSILAFERAFGGRHEIWTRYLRTGEQRLVASVQASGNMLNATVAPDGSRISYMVPANGLADDLGTAFTIELSGGVPQPVCERCVAWGFLPDGRQVVVSDASSVRFVAAGVSRTVLTTSALPGRPLVSPDGRSIAFRVRGPVERTYVAPLGPAGPVSQNVWSEIDEHTPNGRPCGWSPDSSVLYLLLDADGFRDLWAQKIDTASRPVGKPYVVRHMHGAYDVSTTYGNAISAQGFVYEAARLTGNVWRLAAQPPAP